MLTLKAKHLKNKKAYLTY